MSLSGIHQFRQFSAVTHLTEELSSWSKQTDIQSEKVLGEIGARAAGLLLIPLAALVDVVAHTLFAASFVVLGVIFLPIQAIVYLFQAEEIAPFFKEMFLTSAFMEIGRVVQFVALLALSPLFAVASPRLANHFSKDFLLAQATDAIVQPVENNQDFNERLAQAEIENLRGYCANTFRFALHNRVKGQGEVVLAKLNFLPDSDEKIGLMERYSELNDVALSAQSTNEELEGTFAELKTLEQEVNTVVDEYLASIHEEIELSHIALSQDEVENFLAKVGTVHTLYTTLCKGLDTELDTELLEEFLDISDRMERGENFKEEFDRLMKYSVKLNSFVATMVEDSHKEINRLKEKLEFNQQNEIENIFQQLQGLKSLLPSYDDVEITFDPSNNLQSEYERAQIMFSEMTENLEALLEENKKIGLGIVGEKLTVLSEENYLLKEANDLLKSELASLGNIKNITPEVQEENRRHVSRTDTEKAWDEALPPPKDIVNNEGDGDSWSDDSSSDDSNVRPPTDNPPPFPLDLTTSWSHWEGDLEQSNEELIENLLNALKGRQTQNISLEKSVSEENYTSFNDVFSEIIRFKPNTLRVNNVEPDEIISLDSLTQQMDKTVEGMFDNEGNLKDFLAVLYYLSEKLIWGSVEDLTTSVSTNLEAFVELTNKPQVYKFLEEVVQDQELAAQFVIYIEAVLEKIMGQLSEDPSKLYRVAGKIKTDRSGHKKTRVMTKC